MTEVANQIIAEEGSDNHVCAKSVFRGGGLTFSLFSFKLGWTLKVTHLILQGRDLQVQGKENMRLGDHLSVGPPEREGYMLPSDQITMHKRSHFFNVRQTFDHNQGKFEHFFVEIHKVVGH